MKLFIWIRLRFAMRRNDYAAAERLALQTGDPELRRLVLRNQILKTLKD